MITSDTNFRGNFDSIEAVWEAIPYGGVEGDYLNIQGVKYRWNKYLAMWENAEVVTETPARETVTFDEDVNMQNNLTVAGVLRAKKFVVDDLPTGIEDVEITESAVSGGNNVITFTYTNGESQTFNVKNGEAGKTMGAFGYASSTASQSTWDTAKNYLVPTATEGEFYVYTYEDGAWYQVDTFQVDIAGSADAVEYDNSQSGLDADNVQDALDKVKSDGTYKTNTSSTISAVHYYLDGSNSYWRNNNNYLARYIPVISGCEYQVITGSGNAQVTFLTSAVPNIGNKCTTFATGWTDTILTLSSGQSDVYIAPSDASYIYIFCGNGTDRNHTVNKIELVKDVAEENRNNISMLKDSDSASERLSDIKISVSDAEIGVNDTPYGFEVGKRYKIRAITPTSWNTNTDFYLRVSASSSANGFNLKCTIPANSYTSGWVDYVPTDDSYQYITSWQTGSRTVTYTIELAEYYQDGNLAETVKALSNLPETITEENLSASSYIQAGISRGTQTYYSIGYAYRVCVVLPVLPCVLMHVIPLSGYKVSFNQWNVNEVGKSLSQINTANGDILVSTSPWYGFETDFNMDMDANTVVLVIAKTDYSAILPSEAIANVDFTIKGKRLFDSDDLTSNDNILNKLQQQTFVYKKPKENNNPLSTTGLLTLLHFSDIHGVSARISRIVDFKNKYSAYIHDIIHTGDSVETYLSDTDPFASVSGAEKILNVIGNHDSWLATASDYHPDYDATEAQSYTKMFAPYISNWGLTNTSQDKCYYYKDYTTQKIRLIVLDTTRWHSYIAQDSTYDSIRLQNAANEDASAQKTWFQSALSSVPSDYSVICAMHYNPQYIKFLHGTGFCYYTTEDTGSWTDGWVARDEIFDCVDTFISGGGKFVCWLNGHTHRDICGLVGGHENQFIIDVTAAGWNTFDAKNVDGTTSQDAFNVFTVDTNKGIVKITRIGQTMDCYMQSKETLCYDYVNKVMISHT